MYFRIRMSNNWNYIYFIAKKLQRKQLVTDDSLQGTKKAAKPKEEVAEEKPKTARKKKTEE